MSSINALPEEVLLPLLLSAADKRTDLAPLKPHQLPALFRTLREQTDIGPLIRKVALDVGPAPVDMSRYAHLDVLASKMYLADTYSQTFAVWLCKRVVNELGNPSLALAFLIAHSPNVESISYSLYDVQDQRLLLDLFRLCAVTRTAGVVTSRRMPLMQLAKVSLYNRSFPRGLEKQTSIVWFPLQHMQLDAPSPTLPRQPPQQHLRRLDIKNVKFDKSTIRDILQSFPGLHALNYGSWIMPSYESGEEEVTIHLDPVGDALRELGGNLVHLNFSITVDTFEATLDGRVDSLREMASLKTLAIPVLMLLGEDDSRSALADSMPSSIEMISMAMMEDGLDEPDFAVLEKQVRHLLRQCERHPNLLGVSMGLEAGGTARVKGWERGDDEDSTWYTRREHGKDHSHRLLAYEMACTLHASEIRAKSTHIGISQTPGNQRITKFIVPVTVKCDRATTVGKCLRTPGSRLLSRRAHAILRPHFWRCVEINPAQRPAQIAALLSALQRGDAGSVVLHFIVYTHDADYTTSMSYGRKSQNTTFDLQPSRQWMVDNYSESFAD
ncbi:hypothetical protein Micbo1qcDRAFT_178652 [Microdochium bolleyi]|uniref:Uncharacterized protein n=1 Tax=Microdochium bolleyi TaxID=196109 RepID=A0A136ISS8_9PEZI|nr:hypothetical protein Micbo1qcDRAFT_178652 [Microdochium bolleyi]